MDAFNRMRLAQYHNRRGVRMLKCASGVESCRHREAFVRLAKECFEARNYQMGQARLELGKRRRFDWHVILGFEVVAFVVTYDELSAGAMFEAKCEEFGIPPGEYMVKRAGRSRLRICIMGDSL